MSQPTEAAFRAAVAANQLSVTPQLLPHSRFAALLALIRSEALLIIEPSIASTNEGFEASGTGKLLGIDLTDSSLEVWNPPAEGMDWGFDWCGALPKLTLAQLQNANIVPGEYLGGLSHLLSELMPNVGFCYTSFDHTLTFQCTGSTLPFQPEHFPIQLQRFGFLVTVHLNKEAHADVAFLGDFQLGSSTVKAALEMPAADGSGAFTFTLRLREAMVLNNALADVVQFMADQPSMNQQLGGGLLELLPEQVSKLPTVVLNEFVLRVRPDTKTWRSLHVEVQTADAFTLMPGLVIEEVGVSAYILNQSGPPDATVNLFGGFTLAESVELWLDVLLPLNTSANWVITMAGSVMLAGLKQLEVLPFLKLDDMDIPTEWLTVEEARLDRFEFEFHPATASVKRVALGLTLNAEASVLPGVTISEPSLDVELTFD